MEGSKEGGREKRLTQFIWDEVMESPFSKSLVILTYGIWVVEPHKKIMNQRFQLKEVKRTLERTWCNHTFKQFDSRLDPEECLLFCPVPETELGSIHGSYRKVDYAENKKWISRRWCGLSAPPKGPTNSLEFVSQQMLDASLSPRPQKRFPQWPGDWASGTVACKLLSNLEAPKKIHLSQYLPRVT